MHKILEKSEVFTVDCKVCVELLNLLHEVKRVMDSEVYIDDYDTIYDKIVSAIKKYSQ